MLHFFGSHYVELAAATATVFILVLGFVGLSDALTHRSR